MAPNDLLSATKSLKDFLGEAKRCAEYGMGFAAMLTSLPVIFAVGKVDTGQDQLKPQIAAFLASSPSYRSWLVHKGADWSPEETRDFIYDLRNALAHNASMPHDSYLVISNVELKTQDAPLKESKVIGVTQFLNAIELYLLKISAEKPHATFDPVRGGARGPAEGGLKVFTASGSGSTGSGKP